MGTIYVDKLEISACHGVNPEEKCEPQPFWFSVEAECDFAAAARSDDVADTVNYSSVCKIVTAIAQEHCFNLIEKLAAECAAALMDAFPVRRIAVRVDKPRAPMKRRFESVAVRTELVRERVLLSLGSNLGDRKGMLDRGVALLAATRGIAVKKVSSYLETEPYGGVATEKFLNAAAEIETYLPPRVLLDEIHRIEAACGRVRKERWGDRTLDIDIVFYGKALISEDGLTVPHPEYAKRAFVLTPLKEIAGDFFCPDMKKRLREI